MFEENRRKQFNDPLDSQNPLSTEVNDSVVFSGNQVQGIQFEMGQRVNIQELDAYLIKYNRRIEERYEERNGILSQEKIDQKEKRAAAIAIENQREREIEIQQRQLQLQLIEYEIAFRRAAAAAMVKYHQKQENDEFQDELDDEKLLAIKERYEALAESSSKFYESLSEKDNLTEDFLEEFYSEIEPLESEYNDLQYDNALDNIEKKGFEVERDADGVKGKTRITGKDDNGEVCSQMTHNRNNHEFMIERLNDDEKSIHNVADNIIELQASRLVGPEHNLECTLKCTPESQDSFSTLTQVLEDKIKSLEHSMPHVYNSLSQALARAKLDPVNQKELVAATAQVVDGLEKIDSLLKKEPAKTDELAQKQQQELDSTPTPDPQTTKSKVLEEDSDLSSGKEDEALPLHKQAQEVMQQKMQEQEMGQQQQKSTWPPNPMMQSDQQHIEVERQQQLDQGTAAPAA